MKKEQKDFRPKLNTIARLSLIVFFLIPFVYANLKLENILKIVLSVFEVLILYFLWGKYFDYEFKQNLYWSVPMGYLFSGLWFFIATLLLTSMIKNYFKENIEIQVVHLLFTTILLFFSFLLLFLSIKSQRHEEEVLLYKQNKKYIWIFIFSLLISIIYNIIKIII